MKSVSHARPTVRDAPRAEGKRRREKRGGEKREKRDCCFYIRFQSANPRGAHRRRKREREGGREEGKKKKRGQPTCLFCGAANPVNILREGSAKERKKGKTRSRFPSDRVQGEKRGEGEKKKKEFFSLSVDVLPEGGRGEKRRKIRRYQRTRIRTPHAGVSGKKEGGKREGLYLPCLQPLLRRSAKTKGTGEKKGGKDFLL